jgi:phosphoadenosine phosphosulfate reductase
MSDQLMLNYDGDIVSKIQNSINFIKEFEPQEGYYLAFSGGKDSIVCYHLLKQACVKFDSHYNWTTVDPPELLYFIREHYPDVTIHRPKETMFDLIVRIGMPPTRMMRYCCQILKEGGGEGRFVVTGVRWAESPKRKQLRNSIEFDTYGSKSKQALENRKIFLNSDNDEKRRMMETCVTKGKHILNPIVNWEDGDVWNFIKSNNLSYPSLYDQGYERLGCIGCPAATVENIKKEFDRFPKY